MGEPPSNFQHFARSRLWHECDTARSGVVSHVVGVVYVGEITMNKMSVKEQVQQQ